MVDPSHTCIRNKKWEIRSYVGYVVTRLDSIQKTHGGNRPRPSETVNSGNTVFISKKVILELNFSSDFERLNWFLLVS